MYPEITAMQVRAIFEAACTVAARKGRVQPEVMIPLGGHVVEFRKQALIVRQVAEEVFRERQITVPYLLGTMIELPRAALTADEIAREAQFFSFGTNDLTQTTWGLSRDDAGVSSRPIWSAASSTTIRSRCSTRRRGQADPDGVRAGPADPAGPQGGDLRRARRRAERGRLLRPAGDELRLLLAVPGADRPAGGGAGRAGGAGDDGSDPGDGVKAPCQVPSLAW